MQSHVWVERGKSWAMSAYLPSGGTYRLFQANLEDYAYNRDPIDIPQTICESHHMLYTPGTEVALDWNQRRSAHSTESNKVCLKSWISIHKQGNAETSWHSKWNH